MQVVVICEMFGWTWQDYMSQPADFLALIHLKLSVDAQNAAKEAKKTR